MLILKTPRLIVREFETSDVDALFAITGDPIVTRYVGDSEPLPREGNEKWIEVSRRNYATRGYSVNAIIHRETGAFIGYGGVTHAAEHNHEPELMYGFAQPYWGQGYATEFVRAMLAHAFARYNLTHIIATIDPDNTPSRRVAEKCGMTLDRIEHYDGDSTAFYIIHNPNTTPLT